MRRVSVQEEDVVLRTLDQVRLKEEERVQQSRDAVSQYEKMIQRFKIDITKEVSLYHGTIVQDLEKQLNKAFEKEDLQKQREDEMVEEVRAKIEKEFADQFEVRFNHLEEQLKEKERIAHESKKLLEDLQAKAHGLVLSPLQKVEEQPEQALLHHQKDSQDKALAELKTLQQDELQRQEGLLKQERDQRVAAEEKSEADKV